jgi:V8-like Glu-specific endopeptidase
LAEIGGFARGRGGPYIKELMLKAFLPSLAAGAALASIVQVPALARIVGADERSALAADLETQLSGVGRIVCRDPASGNRFASTATLVGNRSTLLTTGHFATVSVAGSKVVIPTEYCAFELRSADGARFYGSLIAPNPVARFRDREQPDPLTPDWAIVKLRTPAPDSVSPVLLKPIKAEALSRRTDTFMVGYHSVPNEMALRKRYSPSCSPTPVAGSPLVFRHSCDTESGSSGGLIYVRTEKGPRAVGMNHGSATERNWNYGQIIGGELARNLPAEALDEAR